MPSSEEHEQLVMLDGNVQGHQWELGPSPSTVLNLDQTETGGSEEDDLYASLLISLRQDPRQLDPILRRYRKEFDDRTLRTAIAKVLTKAVETSPNAGEILSRSLWSVIEDDPAGSLAHLLSYYASSNRELAQKLGDASLQNRLLGLALPVPTAPDTGVPAALTFLAGRVGIDLSVREKFLAYATSEAPKPLAQLGVINALAHLHDVEVENRLLDLATSPDVSLAAQGQVIEGLLLSGFGANDPVLYGRLKPAIRYALGARENFEAGDYSRVLGTHQCLSGLACTSPDPDLVPLYFALLDHSPHAGLRSLSVSLLARQMTSFGIEDRLIHVGFDPNNSGDLRDLALSELADKGTGISLKQMDQALADPALADSDRGKIQEYRDWLAGRLQTGK